MRRCMPLCMQSEVTASPKRAWQLVMLAMACAQQISKQQSRLEGSYNDDANSNWGEKLLAACLPEWLRMMEMTEGGGSWTHQGCSLILLSFPFRQPPRIVLLLLRLPLGNPPGRAPTCRASLTLTAAVAD